MPQIKLIAKLKAYSKAPFYGDYVRYPENTVEDYRKDVGYILRDGKWVDTDTFLDETAVSIKELNQTIKDLESSLGTRVDNLKCYIDYTNQSLIFIDDVGNQYAYILPSASTDNITVGLTSASQITLLDTPDDKSIKVVDVVYKEDEFGVAVKKESGKLKAYSLYMAEDPTINLSQEDKDAYLNEYISGFDIKDRLEKHAKEIDSLKEYTQGIGGFLESYRFFPDVEAKYNTHNQPLDALSETVRNTVLTKYALDQVKQSADFKAQTKVKDLYDNSIWVWNGTTWINEGKDTIVNATNTGILGAVTGVAYDPNNPDTRFKISIGTDSYGISNGIMSVNGLEEAFTHVIYKGEGDSNSTAPGSYVQRTSSGTIVASASVNDSDVVNQGQFNEWQTNAAALTALEITSMVEEYFRPVTNGGQK